MRLASNDVVPAEFWPIAVFLGVGVAAVAARADVESDTLIDPPAYILAMVAITWHLGTNIAGYDAIYGQGLIGEGSVYAAYVVMPMAMIAAPIGAILAGGD